MRENPWLPLRRRSFADTRVLLQQATPSLEVAIVISTLGHGSSLSVCMPAPGFPPSRFESSAATVAT